MGGLDLAGAAEVQRCGLWSCQISNANQGHAQSGPDRKAPSEILTAPERRHDSGGHCLCHDSALN